MSRFHSHGGGRQMAMRYSMMFAQRGGMINFVRHERTFRFEINLEAAERAGLRISSRLASMATVIKTTTPP